VPSAAELKNGHRSADAPLVTDLYPTVLQDADALLAEYGLPELAPHEQLRAVTRVAATVAAVPNAVVNLLSDCFQHQVGEVGFPGSASAVEDSMCAVALRDQRLRYLPDARLEPAFEHNPWVDGQLASVGLYATAPLTLPDGRVLGSLCVFSEQAGELSAAQLDALTDLAAHAVAIFEQARLAREAAEQAVRYRQARDQAERRSALTAAVLETVDVAILASDADGRFSLSNRAARHTFAMDDHPQAELGRRYSLYAEDGTTPLPADRSPLARTLREGAVRDEVLVVVPDDRPPITVRCDGQAMVDHAGTVLGAVVAYKDITAARAQARELTEARDLAEAATRAKTAFLAAASHEIRTPLNGVLGMLEMLAMDTLSPHQQEYVEIARTSGEALLRLLNDVLDLSKAETTSVVLAEEPVDPHALVAEVVSALSPVAARKGLAFAMDGDSGRTVIGDPGRLRQVVMNLVGNALKFTERGRVDVDVAVTRTGQVRIAVTDTGAGMSAEEAGQLFQPFTQGAQGARHGGTGLGLALSRQLVDLMGGSIDVASQLGAGSSFTVTVDLPLSAPLAAQPPPVVVPVPRAETVVPSGDLRRALRVLVADDNEINLMVAGGLLSAEGAEVVTVGDGDDAVQAVRDGAFDLVLLDLQMPRMSGLDAARAIRALPGAAARTRVLALTAETVGEATAACLDAGLDGVLLKPVRGADVRRVLGELAAP
jgi:signal transduction histidine kinase